MPESSYTRLLRRMGRYPDWYTPRPDHETDWIGAQRHESGFQNVQHEALSAGIEHGSLDCCCPLSFSLGMLPALVGGCWSLLNG
jgi:hypothetical protein